MLQSERRSSPTIVRGQLFSAELKIANHRGSRVDRSGRPIAPGGNILSRSIQGPCSSFNSARSHAPSRYGPKNSFPPARPNKRLFPSTRQSDAWFRRSFNLKSSWKRKRFEKSSKLMIAVRRFQEFSSRRLIFARLEF